MVTPYTNATFASDVLASPRPVLVDFSATWCPPCRMLAPVIDRLAQDLTGSLAVGAVDVDREPELATAYGITALPTVVLFQGGQPVGRLTGFHALPELKRFVQAHAA